MFLTELNPVNTMSVPPGGCPLIVNLETTIVLAYVLRKLAKSIVNKIVLGNNSVTHHRKISVTKPNKFRKFGLINAGKK